MENNTNSPNHFRPHPHDHQITEKNERYVKNFGIWIKYNSRSGTHNMYREYRDTTLTGAVDRMYDDMAGRHRSRNKSIQIIRTAAVAPKLCKRTSTMQFHKSGLKFPLPHRIMRSATKSVKSVFSATRPNTHFR